ncbi:LPXTG cell wall anchor domain-containing protein [Enterococcus sp. S22(2020)]|nr:LPXTG cell wall anchor domain-containing protein [Enterococcus sp. S23]MCA5017599.1 LPXTG cell wall anchor domain-containing protein [Enterococcus sp. S22(2020)]
MRMNKLIILLSSLILLISLAVVPSTVYGTEGAGGQVTTGGKISFYEDSLEPSENLPEVGSSTEQESEVVVKPVGKLPSTGELIRNFSFVGIGLLVLFLLLLLVRKRVKEEK